MADLDWLAADQASLSVLDLLRLLFHRLACRLALGRAHSYRAVTTGSVLLLHCLVVVAAAIAFEGIAVATTVRHFGERIDRAAACKAMAS